MPAAVRLSPGAGNVQTTDGFHEYMLQKNHDAKYPLTFKKLVFILCLNWNDFVCVCVQIVCINSWNIAEGSIHMQTHAAGKQTHSHTFSL